MSLYFHTYWELVEYLRDINLLSMVLRFLLAAIGGGIIGMSRGRRQHAAGMRTHLLVCIGSASVMITSQFVVKELGLATDVLRMPAQVISGIGFLGAGSIIVTAKKHVTGLTTAAGLWASACMGLAAGIGYYECAIAMCLLIYIVLVVLNKLDATHVKSSRVMTVFLEMYDSTPFSQALCGIKAQGIQINGIETFPAIAGTHGYLLELEILRKDLSHAQALEAVSNLCGVSFCEEMKA